ncbi:MAG: hypothetical protein ABJC12_10270 [Saprospiraceae bacterium]
MKPMHFYMLLLFTSIAIVISCNSKKEVPAVEENATSTNTTASQNSIPADTVSVAAAGEQHYICPNHCKGSGSASEGKCPVCGTAYVHNDAFDKGHPVAEPQMRIDPVTHMAVPTHTEAQNSKGVYHFICPNGDPGGAGVAGKCAKCGAALVHNQAFHNN